MKILQKNRIIRWVVLPVIIVSALFFSIAAYAAYTNVGSIKRVVSTQGLNGTPFSSDYLNLTPSAEHSYSLKNITFPESADTISFTINVCNYVHNNPSKFNENDIRYVFSLTLSDTDGVSLEGLSVSYGGNDYTFSNGVCSFADLVLKGSRKSVDTYKITVPKSFVDKVRITALAIPDTASYEYTGNYKLARRFAFTNKSETANTWSGSFAESTVTGYDGFNYIVSGQGKGTVTIRWNTSNLEINSIFLQENGISPSGNSISFEVDSDNKNRYDIQFYKTENGSYPDMETLSGYISLTFTEAD